MSFSVSRRGAVLAACWLSLAALALATAVWLVWSLAAAVLLFLLLAGLSFAGCLLHWRAFTVRLTRRELQTTQGFFFRLDRRVPLRSVVGVEQFSTPLARRLAVTVLLVRATGGAALLVGLSPDQAAALRAALLGGQAP